MLTLFIIPSLSKNADIEKTVDSFSGIKVKYEVVSVTEWRDVNNYKNKGRWFGIFWDNESIDNDLREALPIYFMYQRMEALILYKKTSMTEAVWRYRFFRDSVYLGTDFCPVSLWLCKEAVLDGWVLEHEYTS